MSLQLINKVKKLKKLKAERKALAERERRRRVREREQQSEEVLSKPTWPEFAKQTRIRSGRQLVPFNPYLYQASFVEEVEKHYGTIAVKSRQMGFTETVGNYFLWKADKDPGYLAVIFSKNQGDTANIAKRVRLMISSRNDLALETDSLQDLKLVDGGRLLFKPATPNAARSLESVSAILFDEAAFVDGIEGIYSAAMPSTEMLGDDARIIILSTPNGQSGFYWDRVNESNGDVNIIQACQDVRTGEPIKHWTDQGGWCKFLAHWRAHPVYSKKPNYLQHLATQKRMPETKVRQEYDLDFTIARNSLFNFVAVQKQATGAWSTPIKGHKYLIGVDPNFGGSDYFRAQVWDITATPASLVAEYGENQRSIEYSKIQLKLLINQYNPLLTAIESNSGGIVILENLVSELPGLRLEAVSTTRTSKRINTDRIAISVEQGNVIYPPDWDGIKEMSQFSAGSREATSGHDDCVMAFAVAWAYYETAQSISGNVFSQSEVIWRGNEYNTLEDLMGN